MGKRFSFVKISDGFIFRLAHWSERYTEMHTGRVLGAMSEDEISKLVELADKAVYEYRKQGLESAEREILQRTLLGEEFIEIKTETKKLTVKYIRHVKAPKLWKLLTDVFGKEVTKRNVEGILLGLQERQLRSHRRKSQAKTSRNGHDKFDSKLMVLKSTLFSGAICSVNNEPEREPPENPEREVVQENLNELSKSKKIVKIRIPLAIFGLLGIWWFGLSWLANYYGAENYQLGKLPQAELGYRIAAKLNPWSSSAHYNLGTIYEDQQNYPLAQAEYQRAMELGEVAAYNNQARLYLLSGKYDSAVSLLQAGIQMAKNDFEQIRYSFLKNLGWARLLQGRLEEAEVELGEAIAIKSNRADAHCLLAQVKEGLGEKEQALLEWENCLRFTHLPRTPEEDKWISLAQQRLKVRGEKK